MSNSKTLLKDR